MIYSLLILSSPFSGDCSRTAAAFARCAIARGHTVHRVFFLDTGTLASAANSVSAQDEDTALQSWAELADLHSVELAICITSALKHGMFDQTEADRNKCPFSTMDPAFTMSGLGQLVDAYASSDRLITFGG